MYHIINHFKKADTFARSAVTMSHITLVYIIMLEQRPTMKTYLRIHQQINLAVKRTFNKESRGLIAGGLIGGVIAATSCKTQLSALLKMESTTYSLMG